IPKEGSITHGLFLFLSADIGVFVRHKRAAYLFLCIVIVVLMLPPATSDAQTNPVFLRQPSVEHISLVQEQLDLVTTTIIPPTTTPIPPTTTTTAPPTTTTTAPPTTTTTIATT